LLDELIEWNYEMGTSLTEDITTAWDNCLAAAKKYGNFVSAMNALPADISSASTDGTSLVVSGSTDYDNTAAISGIIENMMLNSEAYFDASDEERTRLSSANQDYANNLSKYGVNVYRNNNGSWIIADTGESLYENYLSGSSLTSGESTASFKDERVRAIVSQMRSNSAAWLNTSDADKRSDLYNDNITLSKKLSIYGVKVEIDPDGNWRIKDTGELLYNKYKYHTGGIAGDDGTLKENELLAKLERGEVIVSNQNKSKLFSAIEFMSKLNHAMDVSGLEQSDAVASDISQSELNRVSNHTNATINLGDVYIYGADGDTVEQHVAVNRQLANDILAQLNIRR
jgi:hypothetical protein